MDRRAHAPHLAFFPVAATPARAQIACAVCGLQPMCDPRSAPPGAPAPVEARRRLRPGEALFRAGDPNTSLFAVRAGFMKECVSQPGGGMHVVRFLMPGDVAGLDGCATGIHQSDAVALGDCEVCEIAERRAHTLADFNPRIGAHFRRLLAQELARSRQDAATIACLSAEQRVARFLLDLGRRWLERGYSGFAFQLPMTRREIGDHLGLKPETLSRALSAFQARGWIRLERRAVEMRDARALGELLAGSG
jgi:CRP/FNR family transcriptional regulator